LSGFKELLYDFFCRHLLGCLSKNGYIYLGNGYGVSNKEAQSEAYRYLENAKDCLKKAGKEGKMYSDKKYVKMAGNTSWNGVLFALEHKLGRPQKGARPSIKWYHEKLAAIDKKANRQLETAYDILHLAMGYDGNLSVANATDGMEIAKELIDWSTR
jgi:hypothetical protein